MAERQDFDEEALEAADNKADATVVVVIFCTLVAMAVFYASGWTFDL
ncbi:MAG: hypothetical protein AAF648_05295 [Pseudomonadota bacterium]